MSSVALAAVIASAAGCGIEGRPREVKNVTAASWTVVLDLPSPSPRPTRGARPVPSAQTPEPSSAPRSDDGEIPWPWIAIADCESGDGPQAADPPYHPDWDYHGRTYDGGLNFAYSTWDRAWELLRASLDNSVGKAKRVALIGKAGLDAWRHSAQVQVRVAKDWLKRTSWGQWPVCSRVVGVR